MNNKNQEKWNNSIEQLKIVFGKTKAEIIHKSK